MKPLHPGEILREEFTVPLGLSMNKMAMDLRVPVTRIADIVNERRGITADTASRFARYFKNSPVVIPTISAIPSKLYSPRDVTERFLIWALQFVVLLHFLIVLVCFKASEPATRCRKTSVARANWRCRACHKLRYASEGGALVLRSRMFGRSRCARPEPWYPIVFTSREEAAQPGV